MSKNSKILLDALHDIYEGEVSDLTITDLSKIKEYTDSLTSENNTTLYELFSNLTVEGE